MKKRSSSFPPALVALLLLGAPLCGKSAPAAPSERMNPYDLLGRVLTPIASVFCPAGLHGAGSSKNKPQALRATLVLQEMTGAPPESAGTRVVLALQPPDRALVRFPFHGKTVTLCRNDQHVWIEPRAALPAVVLQSVAAPPETAPELKQGNQETLLAPMTLPVPAQELAFLPVLFTVKDAGDAQGLRILDVWLMPELGRHLGAGQWSARLFVRPGDAAHSRPELAGLELVRPGWRIVVRVESLEYSELPPSTWVATTPDAVSLTGTQARQWIEEIGRLIAPE